ncbi:hypothetical protein HON58_02040 [Candidatus Peregrinibacteria bacterium]|nr:hypothetical protein [Candidatus Peregrinibacteria bacterium]
MKMKRFFKLTKFKTFLFGVLLMNAIYTTKTYFACVGGPCEIPITAKIFSYFMSLFLPGINNLFSDNGFFIGYKTYGLADAIPQLIFHVGVDILYLYLILCLVINLYPKLKKEGKKQV